MKYSEKFPDMKPVFDEQQGVIKGIKECPCFVCGESTFYVDINYEARICSEECLLDFERSIYVY